MFAELSSSHNPTPVPYRARYKANFAGTQDELAEVLLALLENLDAIVIDDDEPIRLNPSTECYELAAVLNTDLEFSLLIYWPDRNTASLEVTFDLDSPSPIEIAIEEVFLNPATAYFPDIRQIYNFLSRPKVTIKKSDHRTDILKNQQWIKDHRQEYRGRWVALQDGDLLADAESSKELLQKVDLTENTLLTAIY